MLITGVRKRTVRDQLSRAVRTVCHFRRRRPALRRWRPSNPEEVYRAPDLAAIWNLPCHPPFVALRRS
jgi:hypothetical protein